VVTVDVKSWTSKNEVAHIVLAAVKRLEQKWSIKATVIADWVEVVLDEVDGREKGMLAQKRAEEVARANGWKLASGAPQWVGQRWNFNTYEGSPTGLVMTLVRRDGESLARNCVDSLYMIYGKRVVGKLKVFQLHRDGAYNYYVNEKVYKVSWRASEHGPYAPPQWSPYRGKDKCPDCGDWRHRRCSQNMRQPVCNVCKGLHLDGECPRGMGSLEDLRRRKRKIARLLEAEERRMGKFEMIEEEMEARYPTGKAKNQWKNHNNEPRVGTTYYKLGKPDRSEAPVHQNDK